MDEESLFAAALERPTPAERRAFLDAACAGDAQLRDRVGRLLAADEQSRGILDHGTGPPVLAACQPDTLSAGRAAGAGPSAGVLHTVKEADPPGYELSEPVGEGGMGVVYRARDARLARDVAVKLLHPRFDPAGPAAKRFLGEARVTAQIQHPGVPPVHQVGALPDGRPFLVMKLIKGRTLADLLAGEPADRGRLVAAFEQVCQAVAYAHSRGVVHRDLKPANVMVGAFGEVQVMDWGLAKVLGPADGPGEPTAPDEATAAASAVDSDRGEGDATRTGSVLGTPAYMSPEQAIGAVDQVDARSDVFGLGAILCAVLTGRPPYAGADPESARQMAARGKLDDAFARLDGCGADPGLVELCKRCLAPEKADRPADAGEVAKAVADLRAAAEERARTAERERARAEARAAEQRKRRRVQAGLGLTLAAVVALVGFGLWRNERHKAEGAADRASRQSRTAASVSAALDDARARIGEAWALADEPDKMRAATDLALAALHRAEGFADAGEPTPDTLAELAAVRADAADLDRHTRLFVAADQALQAYDFVAEGQPAGAVTTERLAEVFRDFGWDPVRTPAAEIAPEVAASRVRNIVLGFLCDWEFRSAHDPVVQGKVREVIRAARVRSGGLLAEWQRVKDAGDPARLAEFAAGPEVLTLGPELLRALGRDLEAAKQPGARLTLMRRAVDRYPAHAWLNHDWMRACLRVTPPRRAEALGAAAAAATARPENAVLQMTLGNCFMDFRETDRAIACFRKAVALAPRQGVVYQALAAALTRAGVREGAVEAYREFVRNAPDLPEARYFLALALRELGHRPGAIIQYREAIRLDPNYAPARRDLGILLREMGDHNGAIAELREAVRLAPTEGAARLSLSWALEGLGDYDGAIAEYWEAIRIVPKRTSAHLFLARLLATGPGGVRDGKQAVEHATRACELIGWQDPDCLATLAAAYAEAGDFDRAVEFQLKALSFPAYAERVGEGGGERLDLYARKKPYRDPNLPRRDLAPPPRAVKP